VLLLLLLLLLFPVPKITLLLCIPCFLRLTFLRLAFLLWIFFFFFIYFSVCGVASAIAVQHPLLWLLLLYLTILPSESISIDSAISVSVPPLMPPFSSFFFLLLLFRFAFRYIIIIIIIIILVMPAEVQWEVRLNRSRISTTETSRTCNYTQ